MARRIPWNRPDPKVEDETAIESLPVSREVREWLKELMERVRRLEDPHSDYDPGPIRRDAGPPVWPRV